MCAAQSEVLHFQLKYTTTYFPTLICELWPKSCVYVRHAQSLGERAIDFDQLYYYLLHTHDAWYSVCCYLGFYFNALDVATFSLVS